MYRHCRLPIILVPPKRMLLVLLLFFISIAPPLSARTYTSGVSREHADGLVAMLMQRIAEKLDIELDMQYAPFARRLAMMKNGEIDIMGGLLKREARESYIYFVPPPYVMSGRKIFFVRKGEAGRIQSYEDLYGLTIGTKINARYFSRFDRDPKILKQPVSSVEQNFNKLLLKRIDAVIYSFRSGYTTLQEMGIADQVEPAAYFFKGENPVYIGISRNSPLMAEKDRVEQVVRGMVDSGELEALIKAFYQPAQENFPKFRTKKD